MAAVNLDELEHAALVVDDGAGRAKALVARATGMIHLLNDDYMDEEAPLPADAGTGDADDVARSCLFLASELSSYITGATLDVNGGMLIH